MRAEEITAAIQANQVVILAGETGSGKTTQIPKMCLAAGRGTSGRIACTQPRRVAALSVSRRVADELDVRWGREVGCKIRFNDETTRTTIIKFLTDGMLLAEVQGDPLLREYDTIIIDEAHERSLNIDFLLGHLRTLRYRRPELKIIITSATIDTQAFSDAFDGAPIIQVEGRTFPVEVIYAPLDELGSDSAEGDEHEARAEALHYIDGAIEAIERILRESAGGDILVFLPSERDIREIGELLEGRLGSAFGNRPAALPELVPLFGRLSNVDQQRVFAPTQRRKIVLATNIAETSLTIPGIHFVVDTGLARISRYSPQARTRRLPIEPVSQSSADQRKGRSGRVADGVCIRLYSEKDFLERPRFTQPEIQRANLADVILRMKAFGLGDIERFPFINMPAVKSIRAGYALLEELGALDSGRREGSPSHPPRRENSADLPAGRPGDATLPSRQLTPIGRELARLPVDPTVGRMILQARTEKALQEVLVIAAGLSVQDPRERPLEKQQQADAAHRRFVHPDSDFLTLLNIWDTYHDEFENLSQAKLRRFCRDHFLSYTRMREWRDIHAQLFDALRERNDFKLTSVLTAVDAAPVRADSSRDASRSDSKSRHPAAPKSPADPFAFGSAAYRAIHRSILAGLLGNVANLDEEKGDYKATHDRRVHLFPGSVLFRRYDPKKKSGRAPSPEASTRGNRAPRWIMAAEITETTRLYARTCARLDPLWALELGAHVVRVSHSEPFWNADAGRVMVKQRTRLYGLEVETRAVGYGKINPAHATEIFLREGLVNDTIAFPLDFVAHNRKVRENVEAALTRTRDVAYLNLDEAVYRFYAERLLETSRRREVDDSTHAGHDDRINPGISSVAELVSLVRERRAAEPRFLMMEMEDLRDPASVAHDTGAFPETLPLENRALPLNYSYKPGQPDDGVTLEINLRQAEALTPAALDWAVPGHLEAKVEHYLRVLPKELRRAFVPLAETARTLSTQLAQRDRLTGRRETLTEALAFQIAERFRVAIDPAVWADKPPPDHLRVRVRVLDDRGREICASRNLAEIDAALHSQKRDASATIAHAEPEVWRRARTKYEKPAQAGWTFGDVPDRILVTEQAGIPVFAFPGLLAGKDGVALRLFKAPEEANVSTERGLAALLELQLSRDLGWLQRDLRALRDLGPLIATLEPSDALQAHAFESIRRWLTESARVSPASPSVSGKAPAERPRYSAAAFSAAVEKSKADLRGLVPRFTELLREILGLRQTLLVHPQPYPGLDGDLSTLVSADFLATTPYPKLEHIPRYLRAMKIRADRWRQNPVKDSERTTQLAPYVAAVAKINAGQTQSPASTPPPSLAVVERLRWLVEEFRVSLFAQELGTSEPVSAAKLDRILAAIEPTAKAQARVDEAGSPRPIVASPVAAKKNAPLKNLSSLDRLFQR